MCVYEIVFVYACVHVCCSRCLVSLSHSLSHSLSLSLLFSISIGQSDQDYQCAELHCPVQYCAVQFCAGDRSLEDEGEVSAALCRLLATLYGHIAISLYIISFSLYCDVGRTLLTQAEIKAKNTHNILWKFLDALCCKNARTQLALAFFLETIYSK
jgi:hypothetical protein